MKEIDSNGLPGKYKSWIFQHVLLPRMMWMLAFYEFPVSSVERMERHISNYLWKWLGALPSWTCFNCHSHHEAGVQTRSGRKWAASTEVKRAEVMLVICDIVSNLNPGRSGLGTTKFKKWKKAVGKEKRDMILGD